MPAMPNDIDDGIRTLLRQLGRSDVTILKGAVFLEKFFWPSSKPKGPEDLLDKYEFSVEEECYNGIMTVEQSAYLAENTSSKKSFFKAILRLMDKLDTQVNKAVNDLRGGVRRSQSRGLFRVASAQAATTLGCCTFGGGQKQDTTEATCRQGLMGKWDTNPCRKGG